MKKLTNYLSKKCLFSALVYLVAFLILPIKLVLFVSAAYLIAHSVGIFKLKFPDVWELEENEGDIEKPHRIFLTVPTLIAGKWYIFSYVNRVVVNGETSLSFGYLGDMDSKVPNTEQPSAQGSATTHSDSKHETIN